MRANYEFDQRAVVPGTGPVFGRRRNPGLAAAADQRGAYGHWICHASKPDLDAVRMHRDLLDVLQDNFAGEGWAVPADIGVLANLVDDDVFDVACRNLLNRKRRPLLVLQAVLVAIAGTVFVGVVGRHAAAFSVPQDAGKQAGMSCIGSVLVPDPVAAKKVTHLLERGRLANPVMFAGLALAAMGDLAEVNPAGKHLVERATAEVLVALGASILEGPSNRANTLRSEFGLQRVH